MITGQKLRDTVEDAMIFPGVKETAIVFLDKENCLHDLRSGGDNLSALRIVLKYIHDNGLGDKIQSALRLVLGNVNKREAKATCKISF